MKYLLIILEPTNFLSDILNNLSVVNNLFFPFCDGNNIKNLPCVLGAEFLMSSFLKLQFIDNLRNIGVSCRFDLQADVFSVDINIKIDIVSSVPFVRCGKDLNPQFVLQLAINGLDFGLVSVKCPMYYKMNDKVDAILFLNVVDFRTADFRDFNIKRSSQLFEVIFGIDVLIIKKFPFFFCFWGALPDQFRNGANFVFFWSAPIAY